jgi:hypothetical protein
MDVLPRQSAEPHLRSPDKAHHCRFGSRSRGHGLGRLLDLQRTGRERECDSQAVRKVYDPQQDGLALG